MLAVSLFFVLVVEFLELVDDDGPGAVVDFGELVEVALRRLAQEVEHLPLVALYDLVVGRLLDEGDPQVQKQAPFLHEEGPEHAGCLAVDVFQPCLLGYFERVLVNLLVPGFVFYQLLLQLRNDLGPAGD